MIYTLQSELDTGGFGARWGCYATSGSINIVEHELHRKLTEDELDMIVGRWFRMRVADMSNYKDHAHAGGNTHKNELGGWSPEADPEWHWWILNRRAALLVAMNVAGVTALSHEYETHIIATPTFHYVTYVVDQNITINPDPSLSGPTKEIRSIEV